MNRLTDRYAVVGIGETPYVRRSNRTTLDMAVQAVKAAVRDAGLELKDIDGLTSYQSSDSCTSHQVAHALGLELNYGIDVLGLAGCPEALIAHAIGVLEQGAAKAMVLLRSMNGRSGVRSGGRSSSGTPSVVTEAFGMAQYYLPAGMRGAPSTYSLYAMRYLHEFGYTTDVFRDIAIKQREHAMLNPKALRREELTAQQYEESRWIVEPFRLFDCCQETDSAIAMVIVAADRAVDLAQPAVYIRAVVSRAWSEQPNYDWSRARITSSVGRRVRDDLFSRSATAPEDVDVFGMYDNFSANPLYWWEAMGYCGEGEAGAFIDGGKAISIDGPYPQNLSGGQLSEGYTHGFNLITENVRQLRGRADDACAGWAVGAHTFDRSRGCRQAMAGPSRSAGQATAAFPRVSLNVGTGSPKFFSAVILGSETAS